MALTDAEQAWLNYLQVAYPAGIRTETYEDGTIINIYDKIRAMVISYYAENMKEGMQQLIVQTATETGILEWENFLLLPVDITKSLSVRRATIIAKLVGSNPTIATIKAVLQTIVGTFVESVSIRELFRTSADPDDVFTYEVRLYAPIEGDYDTADMQALLETIHPAHCNVLMVLIPVITDAVEIDDDVDYVEQFPFDWAAESAGVLPADGDWTPRVPFFQAGYAWTEDGSYYPTIL